MSWAVTRIVIVVSLLLFTGLVWWLPNALLKPAMRLTGMERHDPDYYIENFTVTAMNLRGTPKYKLDATLLLHYPHEESTRLDRPRLVEYDANDNPTVTTADHGFVSRDGKHLLMSGNVRVVRGRDDKAAGGEIVTNQLTVSLE